MGFKKFSQSEKETYQKQKEAQKNELKAKIKDMAENYETNPEEIAEYLQFKTKFYQYSVRNTMLIMKQNKNAEFVGSYEFFRQAGYHVLKGAKAMKIFVPVMKKFVQEENEKWIPFSDASEELKKKVKEGKIEIKEKQFFKIGNVFEIGQTDCPVEDYPKLIDLGYESKHHESCYKAITEFAKEKLNYIVSTEALAISLKGRCIPGKRKIEINKVLQDTVKLSTLAHELGHAIIHHDLKKAREEKPLCQIELEADMFSIMLQAKLGLEINDARKRHLSQEYQDLKAYKEKSKDLTLEKIFENVSKEFAKDWPEIKEYIEKEIAISKENLKEIKKDTEKENPIKKAASERKNKEKEEELQR